MWQFVVLRSGLSDDCLSQQDLRFRLGLFVSDAPLQAREHTATEPGVRLEYRLSDHILWDGVGYKYVPRRRVQSRETGLYHADNFKGRSSDLQRLPMDVWPGTKCTLPETITNDG